MANEMFCFQCEQTMGGVGCTGKAGCCGKTAEVANLQDGLTGAMLGLASAVEGIPSAQAVRLVREGLFTTVTNVNFAAEDIRAQIDAVAAETEKLGGSQLQCSCEVGTPLKLWSADEDIRSLKSLILFGLRGMAAYACHAAALGCTDDEVDAFFFQGLRAVANPDAAMETLLPMVLKVGEVNLKCMALLDKANTGAYGVPAPTAVTLQVEAGPFIVISGHDLRDLELLLRQTQGKGVNVYTHGEMLPAHAYPGLKKYAHLKGNFGTAWQNQQREFDGVPGAFLFTTNCLMPPKSSYADRVFTTGEVAYPGMVRIGAGRDFTPVIEKALKLGGYAQAQRFTGPGGGTQVTTGFGHGAVLSVADTIVDAVRTGAIRRFFLVAGCDGARKERGYYTEFVKQAPADTVILTLACGKYRFNDLELGTIGGLPRILDMGQCNDAYSAIRVAAALADAFGCGVNELPLSMVLSWYEQKAVCILLTLLYLGIQDIYLGPTLPAFLSPNVLNFLVEQYHIHPTTIPAQDLKQILG